MSEYARHLARKHKRIDEANRQGLCYCDDECLCGVHAAALHKANADQIAGRRPWPGSVKRLIVIVRDENPVPIAPPLPWPDTVNDALPACEKPEEPQ